VEKVVIIDAVLPNAVRVETGKRLRTYVQRAWDEPQKFTRWLQRNGKDIASRLQSLGQRKPSNGLAPEGQCIDLPVDGPEVEAEVQAFAHAPSRLMSTLLVVRATEEPMPDWMVVDPDQGWGRRAKKVIIHDIAANHLGVLREPHVRSLARAVADLAKTGTSSLHLRASPPVSSRRMSPPPVSSQPASSKPVSRPPEQGV
jgi:thioesterase domain-containing protein